MIAVNAMVTRRRHSLHSDDTGHMQRPEFVTYEHLEYLEKLRAVGVTNMDGATPYLMCAFPLSDVQASEVLVYWKRSFSEHHLR